MAQIYNPSSIDTILAEWDYNMSQQWPLSMREFCNDWNVPRSTFQGWLRRKTAGELPADRYYAKPAEPEVRKSPIDPEAVEVLRMLSSELSSIASDLDELLAKL